MLAIESATGRLYHTPFTPKKRGKISKAGSKKRTCLDKDIKIALPGIPILWKKFDVTIWKPIIGKNMNTILIPGITSSISSLSVVKTDATALGKSSPIKKPTIITDVASIIVCLSTLLPCPSVGPRNYNRLSAAYPYSVPKQS